FPQWTTHTTKLLAIITITSIVYFIVIGIKTNINDVSKTFSSYQQNFTLLVDKIMTYFHITSLNSKTIIQNINIPKLINYVVQNFAGFVSSTAMVLVYILFLILEEKSLINKLPLLFKEKKNLKTVKNIFTKIFSKIRTYMLVKFFTSFLTAIISYIIMKSVNLDFSLFWAILMFLLNFIPTFGSIVASIFPILLSLLQFNDTLLPFTIITTGIIITQLVIGNIIDPKLTGNSLNLSPLVLILSLVIWGHIWGIMGMFLSVPIMIILTIILHEIPQTKKIAVLLTHDGETI
ncbi:MAG: AI-2E family transporter, partial [Alphaproteobacteria bacterium]|nr:AI-2E family transporter [Alphaproteobacteria bacterium]